MHKWIGEDEYLVSCLNCGGAWDHRETATPGNYTITALDGEDPTDCPGVTDQCHHYPNECARSDGDCQKQKCNCLLCDS